MDYVSLLVRSAIAKLDAERRGRERFGSRSVDAAAPGRLKLSRRAWNEYACAIAKGGTSTINLDENPCLQRSHQGCGVILGSRSSFRNAFIRHRGTPRVRRTLAGLCRGLRRLRPWIESTDGVHNIPSILSLYSLNARGEIWSQTEVVHHAGPESIQNNPPNYPPTSVLLVLKMKFYTRWVSA